MKKFHPLSFGLGLGSGVFILFLVFGSMRAFGGGTQRVRFGGLDGANWQQMRGGNTFDRLSADGGPNMAVMAERFGMTEAELQAELASGKTMQDIAREYGVEFPMGRGMMQGSRASQMPASESADPGSSSDESSSVSFGQ